MTGPRRRLQCLALQARGRTRPRSSSRSFVGRPPRWSEDRPGVGQPDALLAPRRLGQLPRGRAWAKSDLLAARDPDQRNRREAYCPAPQYWMEPSPAATPSAVPVRSMGPHQLANQRNSRLEGQARFWEWHRASSRSIPRGRGAYRSQGRDRHIPSRPRSAPGPGTPPGTRPGPIPDRRSKRPSLNRSMLRCPAIDAARRPSPVGAPACPQPDQEAARQQAVRHSAAPTGSR